MPCLQPQASAGSMLTTETGLSLTTPKINRLLKVGHLQQSHIRLCLTGCLVPAAGRYVPRAILMDLVSCPNLLMTHVQPTVVVQSLPSWQPSSSVHAVCFNLTQKDPSCALGTAAV